MTAGKKQKAVWSVKDTLTHVELDIPTPGEGEVLVRNVAIASNPKDFKFPRWMDGYETVEGNDIAGIVEAVGPGVTSIKAGDRVGALTKQKTHHRYGCYQEYSIAPASTTFHLGPNTSFEDAATLPLSFATAALALYRELGLRHPDSTAAATGETLIVHSAASTVGCYATQLAVRSGYRVIGVAGGGSALARSSGCSDIVDYRGRSDEAIAADLRALAPDARLALDCVSAGTSVAMLALALNGRGAICTVLPTKYDAHDQSANVGKAIGRVRDDDVADATTLPEGIRLCRALIYDAHGVAEDLISGLLRDLAGWVEDGSFKPMPIRLIPNGLHGVPEGLGLLMANKVSGQKCVYRVAETPGL